MRLLRFYRIYLTGVWGRRALVKCLDRSQRSSLQVRPSQNAAYHQTRLLHLKRL